MINMYNKRVSQTQLKKKKKERFPKFLNVNFFVLFYRCSVLVECVDNIIIPLYRFPKD